MLTDKEKKDIKREVLYDIIQEVSGWSGPVEYDDLLELLETVKRKYDDE